MVSPSSVTVMRTVPCIAGCEGPRLTVINDDGSSDSSASGSCSSKGSVIGVGIHVRAADMSLAHRDSRAAGTGAGSAHQVGKVELRHQQLPLAHRIIFTKRMPDE